MKYPQKQIYYKSNKNLVPVIVIGLVFVGIIIHLLSQGPEGFRRNSILLSPDTYFAFLIFALIFFGAPVPFYIWMLVRPKPLLTLDRQGLTYMRTPMIPWYEIENVDLYDIKSSAMLPIKRQRCVRIFVKNPEKYLRAGNPIQRYFNRVGQKQYGTSILIHDALLAIDPDSLLATLQEFIAAYGQEPTVGNFAPVQA